jgi:hypothetical protein
MHVTHVTCAGISVDGDDMNCITCICRTHQINDLWFAVGQRELSISGTTVDLMKPASERQKSEV